MRSPTNHSLLYRGSTLLLLLGLGALPASAQGLRSRALGSDPVPPVITTAPVLTPNPIRTRRWQRP
jgi:hypothetical protein